MKISEYEEGFQRPVPSWRQILTVNQKLNRTPLSKRRYVLVAALIALMTLTMEIASHRAALTATPAAGLRLSGLLTCCRPISSVSSTLFETAGQVQVVGHARPCAQKNRSPRLTIEGGRAWLPEQIFLRHDMAQLMRETGRRLAEAYLKDTPLIMGR